MKIRKLAALLTVCAFICGCGNSQPAADTTAAAETIQSEVPVTPAETEAETEAETTPDTADTAENAAEVSAEQITAGMTLEQKIAQMISITLRYWNEGHTDNTYDKVYELNDAQRELLRKYDFGGITVFAENMKDSAQIVRLTADIQKCARESENGIPMLISADQEGGNIFRLPTGCITGGNMALGAAGDEQSALDNASIIGSELFAVGINTDLAPVLDVNNNPSNPVINVRSFSSDPELVRKLGLAFIRGIEAQGVVSTVKHFPGHGDTDTDSHTGLPMIDKSYDELKKSELVPFAAAASEADMVMTAHIQFPQIETGTYTSVADGSEVLLPATLSRTFIKDILRGDLGFGGVVTTDAMKMDAIDVNFDPIDAAVLAINADVDMLLEPVFTRNLSEFEELEDYVAKLVEAVNDGRIAESEIDDSVVRIISLKLEKGIIGAEPVDTDAAAAAATALVGSEEHHSKELEVAERGITLLKNEDSVLPLVMQENEKVAFFYPFQGGENTMTFALNRLKADGTVPESVTAECHWFTEKSASDDYEGIAADAAGYEEMIRSCRAVIVATETYRAGNMDRTDGKRAWQAVFADEITAVAHRNGIKVIHISTNMPYDAVRYTEADAMLCAYCGMEMTEVPAEYNGYVKAYGVNYPAALITVFGGSSPKGKLPVDLYAYTEGAGYSDEIVYPIGFGLGY
ncbi:MAG: glycoside hydrolase family 3 C-terminal domain-containing protein [Ruminiclostridium sp.]|nr:glycoside hydrolase family 3 C-terminal domain-containing protein [Ruminiclostridium sp.]